MNIERGSELPELLCRVGLEDEGIGPRPLEDPVGQRPNAQRVEGMGTLAPLTLLRTVSVEWAVFVSAAS